MPDTGSIAMIKLNTNPGRNGIDISEGKQKRTSTDKLGEENYEEKGR